MRLVAGLGTALTSRKFYNNTIAMAKIPPKPSKKNRFSKFWESCRKDFFKITSEQFRELALSSKVDKSDVRELDLSFVNPVIFATTQRAVKEANTPTELLNLLPSPQESELSLSKYEYPIKTLLPIDIELIFFKFPELEDLNLCSTNLSQNIKTVGNLCDHLAINTKLKNINLSGNVLSADAFNLIFSALTHNSSLKTVNLSGNVPVSNNSRIIDEEHCYLSPLTSSLKKMLKTNKSLESIDLSVCSLNKAPRPRAKVASYFIESLVEGLENNKTLKTLDLRETQLIKSDKEHLKKLLKKTSNNSELKILF